MKKLLLVALALLTLLCFVACDSKDAPVETTSSETEANTPAATTEKATSAPSDDDDDGEGDGDDVSSDPSVDIDYRDQLDEILKKNAEKDFEGIALDAKATVGMNTVTSGVTSNNTMSMDLSLVMNKNYEFSGGFSSAYLFNTDNPLTVVWVDGVIYAKSPSDETLKANATKEDLLKILDLDEMPSFSSDPSEMIPEDVWAELTPEAQDALKNFKPTDLFREVKLTSNNNGVRTITCTGLNLDSLVIISNSVVEDGTDGSPAEEMESVLDLLKNSPFSLTLTVNDRDQITACKLDMKMDMTDMLGSEDGSDTDKAEITLSMDVSITHNPDIAILAPQNADEYTQVELDEMFDLDGSETYPDGDVWGICGTLTNVTNDGMATIVYLDYDEEFNEIEAEIIAYVPEEWMADALALVGGSIEVELLVNGDGSYTIRGIQEYIETYWTYGMLESVETDIYGNSYFIIMDIQYDDDFNEVTVPLTVYVPTDMIDTVSEFVGREVSVNLLPDADGTYTLVCIDLW